MIEIHDFWFGWWWIVALLPSLLFTAAIVWLIVALVRRPRPRQEPSSAIKLLEERFARGEIDREEFVERRGILSE